MTTNLVLDPRQRAMLAEMGVRVWLPSAAAPRSSARALPETKLDVASQPTTKSMALQPTTESRTLPVRRELPLRLPVLSSPPVTVSLAPARYVIGNLPDGGDFDTILLGEPCTGEAKKLLANMLRPLGAKIWVAQMVASHNESESLLEQLGTLTTKVLLALGPHSAKALLGKASQATPFNKLRGIAHSVDGLRSKAIVTYHPSQLLRHPLAKAQTWLDLKIVMKEMK